LSNAEVRKGLGLKDRKHVGERYLEPALAEGLVELTIPDKPRSRLQKYRLTEKGKALIDAIIPEGETS
jgi:predicted transcriptional regulator